MDSIKVNINQFKGRIDKIMCALANLTARQGEQRKAPRKEFAREGTCGILEDGNPLLGFLPNQKNGKVILTQPETNLTPLEGLGAPPVRNEIPQALQISVINPLTNNNFTDLGSQYENPKMVDKYKCLKRD